MITPVVAKVIVLSTLFVATFFFSILPLKLARIVQRTHDHTRRHHYHVILGILSCYAAGVFMATCLLDLLPDTKTKMTNALDRAGYITTYPVPEFLLAFGLFIILFTEQFVLAMKEGRPKSYEPLLSNMDHGHSHNNPRIVRSASVNAEDSRHLLNGGMDSDDEDDDHDMLVASGSISVSPSASIRADLGHPDDADHLSLVSTSEPYQDPSSHSTLRSLMLLFALSLHSIFEGLAVGLQVKTEQVMEIFAALSLHKLILAFSLGMNLVQTRLSIPAIVRCNFLFSIMSPLGIAIGIGVISVAKDSIASTFAQGILQGFACGTFIYVVFFEILPHEFNAPEQTGNRLIKVLALILGFATVALLLFLDPDIVTTNHIRKPDSGQDDVSYQNVQYI